MPRKRLIAASIGVIIAVYGLIRFSMWLYYRYTHAYTEDAFVEADIVNISPLVPGHIKKILVDESQHVNKGQLLFLLDDRDYLARYNLAKAEVAYAQKRLSVLQEKLKQSINAYKLSQEVVSAQVKRAEAGLKEALASFARVKRDYARFKNLYKSGAIGRRKYDIIVEQYKRTKELVDARKAQLAEARAQLIKVKIRKLQIEEIKKEIESAKAAVEKAKRALQVAKLNLEHTRVRAPFDGIVTKKYLHEGDFAAAGYPVLAMYDPRKIYVLANLEETRFKGVKVGCKVDIWVDAYPHKKFRGRVIKILRASAAKFALIPRDVTAGEFTKVVQRIPIKIAVEDKDRSLLIPGMSVEVGILKK